ncbi:uncharacterized protein LOC129566810 [Sitodiplosis mosellana]|uniref:uncharacterized protein LOC129566810 n=1 Tax=Sitodiplosis mosellana TaxID=263140 RepID=UPI002444D3F7|nr:uncharacterized protein LOC129566810 [Sitodiplosis mosellana]
MNLIFLLYLFVCLMSILSSDAQKAESDLNFIGTQIMEQFFRARNSTLSTDCLRQLKKRIGVEFVVEKVYRKKLINKHEGLNRQLYNVNEAFARNPNGIKQDVQLETFFVTDATETYRINISKVEGLMGAFQFPSIQNRKIFVVFVGSNELYYSVDKPLRLATQQMKIKMDPMSLCRVNFNYYTFDSVWNYEVAFEISNTTTIQFPYNLQEPCPSKQSPRLSLNVCSFFAQNLNFVESINYNNEQQIQLEHTNGKYVLKGFPLIEQLSSAEVGTVISDKDDL